MGSKISQIVGGILMAGAVCVGASTSAWSAPESANAPGSANTSADAAATASLEEAKGTITAVDAQSKTLTLTQENMLGVTQQKSFRVDDQVTISDGQRQLQLSDLKRGQEITVRYTKAGEAEVAKMITVSPKAS